MPIFLKKRQPQLIEAMDRPDCDPEKLFRTYSQFFTINSLLSQWTSIYKRFMRPLFSHKDCNTILDIGFGGGDISFRIAQWARNDGFQVSITAVDTDERALTFIRKNKLSDPDIHFLHKDAQELAEEGQRYDFIISNHLLHHLDQTQRRQLLSCCETMVTKRVLFNDIRRSDLGIPLFKILTTPIFRNSFITEDGIISIKKSFTQKELNAVIPPNWYTRNLIPFRLLLMYDCTTEHKTP